jgi:hypothetical protein
MLEEVRHLVRALRNSPGVTAASVLTLALATGATTAIFSLIDGVLLRPLAYPYPERLYVIHELRGRVIGGEPPFVLRFTVAPCRSVVFGKFRNRASWELGVDRPSSL